MPTAQPSDAAQPPDIILVLDAVDPDVVAAFWAEALRYRRVDRLPPFEVLVAPHDGSGPALLVQRVVDPTQGKNRMHLDLHVADPEVEATRLIALGATRLHDGELGDIRWIGMADPEGNEFDLGWL